MPTKTTPILPARSMDETLACYESLGFVVTYRQERPNAYAVIEHGAIELHFFTQRDIPAGCYHSCYVLVACAMTLRRPMSSGSVP